MRSPDERPHAVITRVFRAGRVMVTTAKRAGVKMRVAAFAFNLYQFCTLKNAKLFRPAGSYRKMIGNNKENSRKLGLKNERSIDP